MFTSERSRTSAFYIAAGVLLLAYGTLLFRNNSRAAGGPDESGYMHAAQLFAAGGVRVEVDLLQRFSLNRSWLPVFTPLGFKPSGDRWIVPAYPPGLPIHLLVGGFLVSPVLGLASLVLTFLLARELGLSRLYGAVASAVLAVTPQFILFSLQVMSDVPATFWALLSVWLALRADSRARVGILAGCAFAIGVAVRPTNVLVAIPMLMAVRFRWRPLLGITTGAAPLLAALMWYQAAVYGSALTTGYGGVSILQSSDFLGKLWFYCFWMGRTLSPIVAPLGLLVLVDRRVSSWHRALLTSWYLVFLTFYCFWQSFDDWWYTRFLLPATPALIIATLLLVRDAGRSRIVKACLMLILIAVPWTAASNRRVLRIDDDQRVYPSVMQWSAPLLPRDALVVSGVLSGTFFLYQDRLTARWDRLDPERFAILRERAPSLYAVISDVEVDMSEFRQRLPGLWIPMSRYENVTLYRLAR